MKPTEEERLTERAAHMTSVWRGLSNAARVTIASRLGLIGPDDLRLSQDEREERFFLRAAERGITLSFEQAVLAAGGNRRERRSRWLKARANGQ